MKAFPVVETFGPTIQGEGPEAGYPCCFVRFGGCDYRCSWCDSMYAVEPAEVRKAERLTVPEIIQRLPAATKRVILSGGNPALLELGPLVDALHGDNRMVSVETQGSIWRPWLRGVDLLVISPKPPSSGMATISRETQTKEFMGQAQKEIGRLRMAVKIVVFDDRDYDWAMRFFDRCAWIPFFLSAGTPQRGGEAPAGATETEIVHDVLWRYRWLCEMVATDPNPKKHRVRVLPQLHVLAWGTKRGV